MIVSEAIDCQLSELTVDELKKSARSKSKSVAAFIAVLFLGVVSAFLIAGILVYYYSPSGLYKINQVLLSPEVIERLSHEKDENSGLTFDGAEFSYYKGKNEGWQRIPISLDKYTQFYNLIRSQRSFWKVTEESSFEYEREKPASVLLRIRSDDRFAYLINNHVFQEVQLLPNGHFRVELRQVDDRNRWAYFQEPGIYEKALEIFLK